MNCVNCFVNLIDDVDSGLCSNCHKDIIENGGGLDN